MDIQIWIFKENMKYIFVFVGMLFFMTGCHWMAGGTGQKIFYWERPNTGVVWFAKDHRECLQEADLFPFEWPDFWGENKYRALNLRFDNNSPTGVWAQFVPYPGAKPVYVNSAQDDCAVSYDDYEACMKARHYYERRPAVISTQVFQQ